MSGTNAIRQQFTLAMAQALARNEVSSSQEIEKLATATLDAIHKSTPLTAGLRRSLFDSIPEDVVFAPRSDRACMWARGVLDFAGITLGKSSAQLAGNVNNGLAAVAATATKPVATELLTPATFAVLGGLPLEALSSTLRAQLEKLGVSNIERGALELWRDTVSRTNPEQAKESLGKMALAVRQLSVGRHRDRKTGGSQGINDWARSFGLSALLPDDPAWTDPDFLARINGVAAAGVENDNEAFKLFTEEWRQLCGDSRVLGLFAAGSDAVNYCFTIANTAGRDRLKLPESAPDPKLLVFSGAYGGGRGPSAEISDFHGQLDRPHMLPWRVESPLSKVREPTDPEEIARLEKLEDAAIARIRERAADTENAVGAILIEPIPGYHGVYFYRSEFLNRVRQEADELKIPIIADEILTGGGRTGKMWGYEHFDGFRPDFLTFGKNMQSCGVAKVGYRSFPEVPNTTTLTGDPVAMLRTAFYLKRIRTGGLIENAAEVGAHILDKLHEIQQLEGKGAEASGIGMLLGAGSIYLNGIQSTLANTGRERFMPPLTLTKEQVDQLLAPSIKQAHATAARQAERKREEAARAKRGSQK